MKEKTETELIHLFVKYGAEDYTIYEALTTLTEKQIEQLIQEIKNVEAKGEMSQQMLLYLYLKIL